MSCDHELANERARCSGKNASYITKCLVSSSSLVATRTATDLMTAFFAAQVETTLRIYSAAINPGDFSSSSMEVKQILVSLVDDLGRGLCQGLTTGEPALVAQSHIVVLRSEKNSFDSVDTNFINIACENCTYTVQTTAQVLLGTSLKDRYETWDCDKDGCNGACIVSAQVITDLSSMPLC